MNSTPLIRAGGLLLALVLAACGSSAADRGSSGATAAPPASAAPAPPATGTPAAPSAETRIWGAGSAVSFGSRSFAEWAREMMSEIERVNGVGVALVRITDVSGVRWSTASGDGPGPADIARVDRGEAYFTIGRLVTVELVRMLRGVWPTAGNTALFWLPGGQIGNDRTLPLDLWAGMEPRPGALAVAATVLGADFDATDGVLWMNVAELFPADASGRLWSYDSRETLRVEDVERYLRAP